MSAAAWHTPARVMIDARYVNGQQSGIGRFTENLIAQLLQIDDGLELDLITHPTRPRPFDDPRVNSIPFGAAANSLRTCYLLPRRVDFRGVDLFHSPFNILPEGLPVPSLVTLHDIMWLLDPGYCTDSPFRRAVSGTFYRHFIPRAVRQARRVMTVSKHSRTEIEGHFPEVRGRVDVAYNGLDPSFRPIAPQEAAPLVRRFVPGGRRFVLAVGQGSPYKNHAMAVAGFGRACARHPDLHLVLVRRFERGPGRALARELADPRVSGRVTQVGSVSGLELRALYSLAEAFVFPSLYEGFGLPPLEAMASGTPVVASNLGAPAEVCEPAAIMVDPRDPEAIGSGICRLLEDPALRERYRQRGFAHAATFTWRRCAEQVLAVYRQTLGLDP